MIPKNKTENYNTAPESLKLQMNSTSGTIASHNPEATVTSQPEAPVEKAKAARAKPSGEQINIMVPPQTKTRWKVLFAKNNVKMTQGIIFAIEHLIQEIDNGEVELTVGGVIRKRNPHN